jgi:Uma2 family endonuclease
MASTPNLPEVPAATPELNGPAARPLPPLRAGERLDQKTFHERYEAMPPDVRAELIGGIVYMPSPESRHHSRGHAGIFHALLEYEQETPGTEALSNVTQILNEENEPQPDCSLYFLPGKGGNIQENAQGYLEGTPELLVEIALSSEPIDLGIKKQEYEKVGIKEYVVVALKRNRVYWFVRRGEKFEELPPGPDGILRSEVFPGLWIDPAALLARDRRRLLEVVRQGIASNEHADFVAELAKR